MGFSYPPNCITACIPVRVDYSVGLRRGVENRKGPVERQYYSSDSLTWDQPGSAMKQGRDVAECPRLTRRILCMVQNTKDKL